MRVETLKITQLRNLSALTLDFGQINVIWGPNGSGKTSILEALNLLSTGKSFRSHLKSRLIQFSKDNMVLFARTQDELQNISTLALEKNQVGETKLRHQGFPALPSEIAKLMPIQLLHPHSYELFEGGANPRRQFIDWGVFHVEHGFYAFWQGAQRILKQRNMALKSQLSPQEIALWDKDLVYYAESIDILRARYTEKFIPLFQTLLAGLSDLPAIAVDYYSGWSKDLGLAVQLVERTQADRQAGYTYFGPHRADLKFSVNGVPVQEALSRGQQKILVYAMRFAQARLLAEEQQKYALFLMDDLPSELDLEHQGRIFDLIQDLSQHHQFFLTGVQMKVFQA